MRRLVAAVVALVTAVPLAAAASAGASAAPIPGTAAPGGPGTTSYFDLARKDCVGTAYGTGSKVWYTVADGVLSDVYNPTIDNTNVKTLQYVVTDGSTFTDFQERDLTYTVQADPTGMACTVTATSAAHHYQLVTTYITDPQRASVVMRTQLRALGGQDIANLHVYARLDATVNGNGGGGDTNGGADTATLDVSTGHPVPISYDTQTTSQAANRDYGVPEFLALRADRPFTTASVGYVGTPSDGLTMLDADHQLTTYDSAPNGNVVTTSEVNFGNNGVATLALGFGRNQGDAVATAGDSVSRAFAATYAQYVNGWAGYDRSLQPVAAAYATSYRLAANVLKASEDKTFPGAVVASLSSPWGQAIPANTITNGQPAYFGSYREVFARDLYEAFTGMLADGDVATARATVRFFFDRQQQPDGSFPRNSLLNGKPAPDTGGIQLDETSYPILMARLAGFTNDKAFYQAHIRPAADFVVAHGPSYGVERWEEQSGYSPSTIAAEIAGLVAAAYIADRNGDSARAAVYRATADEFQRNIKNWTVTTTGPYADGRYFLRLSKTGDPNAAIAYNLGNGGPDADQRAVIDAGFLELTRLGELPATDPDVLASLRVVDSVIRQNTDSGLGFYRYGTSTPGSEDGYGDCYVPDATNCSPDGKPWPTGNVGSGHLWPVLDGERAEQQLQTGDALTARVYFATMARFAGGVGLVPEQDWEDPSLPADPWGTDPTTASIGFTNGQPAASANPLTWAEGQEARLARDLSAGRLLDQPSDTAQRYLHGAPGTVPVTITAPTSGATVGGLTTVSGTTAPGVRVQVLVVDTFDGSDYVSTGQADSTGQFAVSVPTPFGSDVITVAATTPTGTGYAQVSVSSTAVNGSTVLDVADPAGDDNGPGTFAYPTDPAFHPGAFDIRDFRVVNGGSTVYLQLQTGDLTPTFGNPIGAQLVDVYVRRPGAATYSTAAAFPQRNYTITADSAWSERIEVQGFAAPVFVDANGNNLGTVQWFADQNSRTITIAVPSSEFGTPASGWTFSVVLHGQDGYSPDQARGFAATPQPYLFGVCQPGGTSPICAMDPSMMPKAMDVITPAGVSQSTELDPTLGPVEIAGVAVP